jgi:pimeloyl-ACP methyl ester carboxylesterase
MRVLRWLNGSALLLSVALFTACATEPADAERHGLQVAQSGLALDPDANPNSLHELELEVESELGWFPDNRADAGVLVDTSVACPIAWRPNALAPVFYGYRDYAAGQAAPVAVRVFFPSLDGSPEAAPILAGCGRFPVVLFAHGQCLNDANHNQRWFQLAAQLARAGYVVAVPQLPSMGIVPSPTHPALAAMEGVLGWLRQTWEHRLSLLPDPATGVAGHSYGGLLAAEYARTHSVAGYAAVGADWHSWSGSLPIFGVSEPKLVIWGGIEPFSQLTTQQWDALSTPKHRAIFHSGEHWDYLPAGQSPCSAERGPCSLIPAATADLVTMFFGKHLPPELSPTLPSLIPSNLLPPQLVLTPEQEFFAGSYLFGMRAMASRAGCESTLTAVMSSLRPVPDVRELAPNAARSLVLGAGLQPVFSGTGTWVYSQSPQAGTLVQGGTTVRMTLRAGPRL